MAARRRSWLPAPSDRLARGIDRSPARARRNVLDNRESQQKRLIVRELGGTFHLGGLFALNGLDIRISSWNVPGADHRPMCSAARRRVRHCMFGRARRARPRPSPSTSACSIAPWCSTRYGLRQRHYANASIMRMRSILLRKADKAWLARPDHAAGAGRRDGHSPRAGARRYQSLVIDFS